MATELSKELEDVTKRYYSKDKSIEFEIISDGLDFSVLKVISKEESSNDFIEREIKLDYTTLISKNIHFGRFWGISYEIEVETCNHQAKKIYIYRMDNRKNRYLSEVLLLD